MITIRKPHPSIANTPSSRSELSSSLNVREGVFACYNFVAPYEYSEKTFGLLAFLLRSSVGKINFSYIIDDAEKYSQQGQTIDFAKLLDEKRMNLPTIEASIEKCLMLNRLISYIQNNGTEFICRLSDIRMDMRLKMTDTSKNQSINYPNDFRQREYDFNNRTYAQDVRRLFYLSHKEAKEPPSIIHLQNRTTEQLSYLTDCKMRYDSKFRDAGIKEILNILDKSFIIMVQPRYDVNPVTIYKRQKAGDYVSEISVIIVSLLHDFMQTHPNFIELSDIKPNLIASSDAYTLKEPQSLSWKTCELRMSSKDKPYRIQYAELSNIVIEQTHAADIQVHFAQQLHSLQFKINLRINLTEYNFSKMHQITLQSLPFAIGSHNKQAPQLLARVMLHDIKQLSKCQTPDVSTIIIYALRYFIHRTGVMPNDYLKGYLREELNKALIAREHFPTPEERFTDFLASYLHQVDFMAKHPVFAMKYDEGEFLGICSKEHVVAVLNASSSLNLSLIALRLNTIICNHEINAQKSIVGRKIEFDSCAVRVDIYNPRTKQIEHLTVDTTKLSEELCKLVSTSISQGAKNIHILSNFDFNTHHGVYTSFDKSDKYYHPQLHKISESKEPYEQLINLIYDVNKTNNKQPHNGENNQNTSSNDLQSSDSHATPSISLVTTNSEQNPNSNTSSMSDGSNSNNGALLQNHVVRSDSQLNQVLVQYFLSKPELLTEVIHQFNMLHLPHAIASAPESQILYQNTQPQGEVLRDNLYPHNSVGQQLEQQQEQFSMTNDSQLSPFCSISDIESILGQCAVDSTDVQMLEDFV